MASIGPPFLVWDYRAAARRGQRHLPHATSAQTEGPDRDSAPRSAVARRRLSSRPARDELPGAVFLEDARDDSPRGRLGQTPRPTLVGATEGGKSRGSSRLQRTRSPRRTSAEGSSSRWRPPLRDVTGRRRLHAHRHAPACPTPGCVRRRPPSGAQSGRWLRPVCDVHRARVGTDHQMQNRTNLAAPGARRADQ
jgi:hypothetical protein